jgi:hypothetical protein
MGQPPEHVPGLRSSERGVSFRCAGICSKPACPNCEPPAESQGLEAALGALTESDRYFMESSAYAGTDWGSSFGEILSWRCAASFLTAARFTRTLVTDAAFDMLAPGAKIVPGLEALAEDPNGPAGFKGVVAGNGQFVLRYADAKGHWSAADRVVLHPSFPESGHTVTISEPARFFEVVRSFLSP